MLNATAYNACSDTLLRSRHVDSLLQYLPRLPVFLCRIRAYRYMVAAFLYRLREYAKMVQSCYRIGDYLLHCNKLNIKN